MQILLLIFLVSHVLAERTTDDDLADLAVDDLCLKGSFSFDGWGYNTEEFPCELCGAGEFSDQEGLDECGVCPPGSFTPDMGYWACQTCPKGSISDEEYSSECYPCYHGQYSPVEGGTSCENCPAGSFQDEEGAGDCKVCPVGEYQDTPASDSCLACPVLTYNDVTGALSCKECLSNTDTKGATECGVSCPAGQVPVDGECISCPTGQFAEADATVCSQCPAGSYSDTSGASQCDLCPAQTYGPTEGLEKCLDCSGNEDAGMTDCQVECPPGQIENDSGNCVPCDAGTFETEGECVDCAGGTFSDSHGSVVCTECPAGSYCPPGRVSPIECPTGSFCPTGSATPSPCAGGTFSDIEGSVVCKECTAGSYCPPETVSPIECPTGSFCPAGAATASPCAAGSYNPTPGSQSLDSCLVCPAGSFCDSEGLSRPTGKCSAGYFCPEGSTSAQQNVSPAGSFCPEGSDAPEPCPKNTYRSEEGGTTVADCSHCPPGQVTLNTGTTSSADCKEVNCEPGYYKDTDKGCIICQKGTFSQNKNADSCTPCPRHYYNSIVGSVECLKCPDTAFTWEEGSDSFDKCIGPVIEVCTDLDMEGTCYRYYDDSLQTSMVIQSLQVISGEFEVYESVNHAGEYATVSQTDGPLNVDDIITVTKVLSFKAVINNLFCYMNSGTDFRGSIRTTARDGKPCMNWSETSKADVAKPNNYCQNPDKSDPSAEPFCFTSQYEPTLCDIPACVWDIDCYTGIGANYRGEQDTTHHTKTCQNWESDWPHPHSFHADKYSWAGIGNHNFCRNPEEEGSGKPWCYTTSLNPWYWWDYCTVARCDRDQFDFYKF